MLLGSGRELFIERKVRSTGVGDKRVSGIPLQP